MLHNKLRTLIISLTTFQCKNTAKFCSWFGNVNWSNTYMCLYGSAIWILRRKETQICALENLLAWTYQCKLNPWHLVITFDHQVSSILPDSVMSRKWVYIMYVYFINKWILTYIYKKMDLESNQLEFCTKFLIRHHSRRFIGLQTGLEIVAGLPAATLPN